MTFDWGAVASAFPQLLSGAWVTVYITVIGVGGGIILGLILGLTRAYAPKVLNWIALVYIEAIRGTPIVVQLMFIYFAMPIMIGIRVDPIVAACTAIIINASAYIAEIVRGAYLSVPNGLREAGVAMGLPFWKILAFVLSPVAMRRLIPPLGNQIIISLKDTSLFIVIGVAELTRTGQEIMATNFKAVEIWATVAVFYLIMTGSLSALLRFIEKRAKVL